MNLLERGAHWGLEISQKRKRSRSWGCLRYDLDHWLISACYIVTAGELASKLKGYDDEEEEDEDDMMAVEGSDGQQYVVLEVIQLADNQGTEQVNVNAITYI